MSCGANKHFTDVASSHKGAQLCKDFWGLRHCFNFARAQKLLSCHYVWGSGVYMYIFTRTHTQDIISLDVEALLYPPFKFRIFPRHSIILRNIFAFALQIYCKGLLNLRGFLFKFSVRCFYIHVLYMYCIFLKFHQIL